MAATGPYVPCPCGCDFEAEKLLIKEAKRGSNEMSMSPRVKEALLSLRPKKAGRVFPGYKRGPNGADRTDLNKIPYNKVTALETVLEAAGIDPKGVGFHAFRHGFISAIERIPGVSYSVVKALARHGESPRDITARYLHPSDEQLRSALAKLEEKIFGLAPEEKPSGSAS